MKTTQHSGLSDTHPEVERLREQGFFRMSAAKKFGLIDSLTISMRANARRAIEDAHPGLSSTDLDLKFIEIHYGCQMANEVQRYLEQATP